ncbi:MAG: metallophosphoesterase [Chloroflexi bacterium]|nr:metallophosphoesterase [Chloroflexota bacterium]
MPNMIGKAGRLFADLNPGKDLEKFTIDNDYHSKYPSMYFQDRKCDVLPIPPPSINPPRINLEEVLSDSFINEIKNTRKISFHVLGDSGCSDYEEYLDEQGIADMMVDDAQRYPMLAFCFHLGDVVYHFGESKYYYDQFYFPFRAYDRPIFAIPGNHDGMVYAENQKSLEAFRRNFCARNPNDPHDAESISDANGQVRRLARSAMTQPGVYFTLDAPMVSIIGLYSNVLEGPGVIAPNEIISSIGIEQYQFLQNELERLKPEHDAGERAVILAVHHPPISLEIIHGDSSRMSSDIDRACSNADFWPDAVLSGHAHMYQRFTRNMPRTRRASAPNNQASPIQIPSIIAGSGGHAKSYPHESLLGPKPKEIAQADYENMILPITEAGYLALTVDMTPPNKRLTIRFNRPHQKIMFRKKVRDELDEKRALDQVTVDLATRQIVPPPPTFIASMFDFFRRGEKSNPI